MSVITNTKITNSVIAVPNIIYQYNIPVGIAPTGSVAANGALTLGTPLDATYSITGIWLYFPAGACYSGSTVGFYYVIMTNTSAGTIYNNTYTPGTNLPTIPESLIAISDAGPGGFVGASGVEYLVAQFTLFGNSMGKNGSLTNQVLFSMTNNSNNKLIRVKFGSVNAGIADNYTTQGAYSRLLSVYNRGNTNRQVVSANGNDGSSSGTTTLSTINTDSDVLVTTYLKTNVATDWMILQAFRSTLYPSN